MQTEIGQTEIGQTEMGQTEMGQTGPDAGRIRGRDRARSATSIALVAVAIAFSGCAVGKVHSRFYTVSPRTVAVLAPENDTGDDLGRVTFDGVLQSAFVGAQATDVAELLRGAVEETLILKGYALVSLPVAAPEVDVERSPDELDESSDARDRCDATVHTTIVEWSHSRGAGAQFRLRYRIEIRHLASDDILYEGEFHCVHQSRPGGRFAPVDTALRRCLRQALEGLPEAAGDDSFARP